MLPNRNVVEDPYFRKELLAIEPDPVKADTLIDNAKWVLSRDPMQGRQLTRHSATWYFTTVSSPALVIYYTFDAKEVLLVSVQKRQP
ncbi:MAG: hypothetical protein ACLQU2_02425 [Candidatus Binataceae bacterium]